MANFTPVDFNPFADEKQVSPTMIASVRNVESGGNPQAVSPKGAVGTMQTMPFTLKRPGYGVTPAANNSDQERERVGIDYLNAMHVKYNGDQDKTLAAYNWGPKRVDNVISQFGDNWKKVLPKETSDYIAKVKSQTISDVTPESDVTMTPVDFNPFEEEPITKEEPSPSTPYSLSDAAIGDVKRIGSNIYNVIKNPIDAIYAAAGLPMGAVNAGLTMAGVPNIGGQESPQEHTFGKVVEPLKKALENPSEVPENVLQYIKENPVSSLMHLSSILGVGGKVAELGGLAKTASGLSKAAEWTNPVTLATKPVAWAGNAISRTGIPESLYGRIMKIAPGSVKQEQRMDILNTMVRDEKLPLNSKTVDKMTVEVRALESSIDNAINNATASGGTISINNLTNRLESMKAKYANRPNPQPYIDAIEDVKQQYINHAFNNNGTMTLKQAHDLKKGTYQDIQDYYMKQQRPETGRIGIQNDVDAAAKAEAASVLRNEVLDHPLIPASVKADMAKESGLLNARKWVERATNRGGNVDPISLSGMMFGVLVEKGIPGTAAWRIATSQPVMSRFAIALGKSGRTGVNPMVSNIPFEISNVYQQGGVK